MLTEENQRGGKAVSNVIGIVLMVAVAVILAGVIGYFVSGVGGDVKSTPSAGLTFAYDDGEDVVNVKVVDPGNTEALYIRDLNAHINDSDITNANGWENVTDGEGRVENSYPRAGDSVTIQNVSIKDDLALIGVKDRKEAIISQWELE